MKSFLLFFRILALEKLGAVFNQVTTPLNNTPRKFALDTMSGTVIMIETDHNAMTKNFKSDRKQKIAEVSYVCVCLMI